MTSTAQQSVFKISPRNRFAVHALTVGLAIVLLCIEFLLPEASLHDVADGIRAVSIGAYIVLSLILLQRRFTSREIETSWTVFSDCSALFLTSFGLVIAITGACSIAFLAIPTMSEQIIDTALASVVPPFVISFLLHSLNWLDRLISLYKSSLAVFFRKVLYATIAFATVVTLLQPWIGTVAAVIQEYTLYVSLMAFILSVIKLPWIQTLSRTQKWKALGICFITAVLAAVLVGTLFGETSQWEFLREWMEHQSVGLSTLAESVLSLVMLYFLRVVFSLALSLPTAGYVDKKMKEVESLAQLSSSITQTRDLDDLLELVIDKVREVCGATGVWIEYKAGEKQLWSMKNVNESFIRRFEKSDGYRKAIQSIDKGVYIENTQQSALFKDQPDLTDLAKSVAGIPLILHGEYNGMIFALHRTTYAFDPTDIELLRAFADNAVIAIENARMLEAARDKEKYRNELLLARQMQQKLLPDVTPELKGMSIHAFSEPAYEVGGDYYDFLTLKNGNTCIVVGDVSGKGISAAFIMAEIKGVMSALASSCSSVRELIVRANDVLIESLDPKEYVTVLAAEIDAGSNTVHICRAGHTPMLLRTESGAQVLQPSGMGVGLVKGALFANTLEQISVQLSQHDACILFTDGVNESVNEELVEFGYESLKEIVESNVHDNASSLAGRIVRSVAEHSQTHEQHDDLTLVVLTVEDEVN